jgi:DNA-binding NarL/FixJ family response regulator
MSLAPYCKICIDSRSHRLKTIKFLRSFFKPRRLVLSKCILIADDSETIRTLIRAFLENRAGFEVCGEAVDGVDAIEKAKELKPDLIILDLAMPRMNGAVAASVLKHMMPKVPIILFTMYDELMSKALASAVKVDLVLAKPNGLHDMVTHVEELLGYE